jgi:hypothetical protein
MAEENFMSASVAMPGTRMAQSAIRSTPRAANALIGSDGSREAANRIIYHATKAGKATDLQSVAAILNELKKTHPTLAQNAYADILSRLQPTRQGELQRLVGTSLANPKAVQQKLNAGQHVLRGTSIASDTLHGAAAIGVQSKAAKSLAPLPAKIIFATVDAKLKYDELRAKGFSHGAAMSGMAAGQGAGLAAAGTGSVVGGWAGGIATSWSGPGAIVGAGGGAVLGGAIAGGIDWAFGLSDKAALAAANAFDGKNIK